MALMTADRDRVRAQLKDGMGKLENVFTVLVKDGGDLSEGLEGGWVHIAKGVKFDSFRLATRSYEQ